MTPAPHPVLSEPATRLLLLASRPALDPGQARRASELAAGVRDWPALAATAARKFSLPMVFQNLAALPAGAVDPAALAAMRPAAMQATAETLRQHAAFAWFHTTCVAPLDPPHAYFKGPALAFRIYPRPALRHFRDIDLLLDARGLAAVTRLALRNGCRVWLPGDEAIIDLATPTAVADYTRLIPTAQLVTPQGVMVELHRAIDPVQDRFPTAPLLAAAEPATLAGLAARVLPDAVHLVHACQHHGRHLWSKLNWLADLAAFVQHPEADLAAARRAADAAGLRGALEAGLVLHAATAGGLLPPEIGPGPDPRATAAGAAWLAACIANLPGDKALEVALRRAPPDPALAGLASPQPLRLRARRALAQGLRPAFHDIRRIPGGEALRPLREAAALLPRLGRSLGRLARTGGPR